jgi:hypothetical protein
VKIFLVTVCIRVVKVVSVYLITPKIRTAQPVPQLPIFLVTARRLVVKLEFA